MKKILVFIISIFLFSNSFAQEGIKFNNTMSWTELLKLSSASGKLIFLDCYTSWCGPCKGMAKDVFPVKEVGDFMNKTFICTSRDMEKGEGIELNKTYKKFIPGYPTYLLINSKGEVVYQVSGFLAPEKFIESMKSGLEQKSWIALSKRYELNKRDWSVSKEYLSRLEAAYQSKILDSVKKEILPMLSFKDISNDVNVYDIFRKYFKNVEDTLFIRFMESTVYRKYKETENEIGIWSGRLYSSKVREYSTALLKDKSSYNLKNAEKLLSDIRRFSFNGREDLIVCLLLYNTAYNNDADMFFSIVEYAKSFGLLRYKNAEISNIIRKYYSNPGTKELLDKCLQYTKVNKQQKFLFSDELRNYAYFLEKAGDKIQSADLIQKADSVDKDNKEKFGALIAPLNETQPKSVQINMEFPASKEGEKVYLYKETDRVQKLFTVIDSVSIDKNHRHSFSLKNPQAGKYQVRLSKYKLDIFLDGSSDLNILLRDTLAKSSIKSNATDSLVRKYEKTNQNLAFTQLSLALTNKQYTDKGGTLPDSILKSVVKIMDTLNIQKANICKEAIKRSDYSLIYIVLNGGATQYDNKELNNAYGRMSAEIKQSDIGNEFGLFLNKLNNLSVGGKVPDFTDRTPEGKEIRLYDFIKGKKIVLLDFWASWCGPCRKENPNVVKIYNKNKSKGFDIISVSLDNKPDNWTAAIAADQLTWTHVSDLGGWKEKTAKLFNVTAVPCTFLIDSNGTIIATNLRGEKLREKVESLCNSK